jgi:hypothetical protein
MLNVGDKVVVIYTTTPFDHLGTLPGIIYQLSNHWIDSIRKIVEWRMSKWDTRVSMKLDNWCYGKHDASIWIRDSNLFKINE